MDLRAPGNSETVQAETVQPAVSVLPISDLGIPSEVPSGAQDLRVEVYREQFDDYFLLRFKREGREISEELEPDDVRKFFKDHHVKFKSRELELAWEEALEKALDEAWNFKKTIITIPASAYTEPIKPFPQFQPQV